MSDDKNQDSVQDVLDSLDDLFEGAMAPLDQEPPTTAAKPTPPAEAPGADEADAILDELLGGGDDGALLDDSLNTLSYDGVEAGLNIHPTEAGTESPAKMTTPPEDDLLAELLGEEPAPAAEGAAEAPSADDLLDELLGQPQAEGESADETPLDEFLAAQEEAAPQDSTPIDTTDAILSDLLGESLEPPAAAEKTPEPEREAEPDFDESDADLLLDELMAGEAEPAEGAPAEDTDALLGELLGEPVGGDQEVDGLQSLEDLLDLGEGGEPQAVAPAPEREPAPAAIPKPATPPPAAAVPVLDDVVIPGARFTEETAPATPATAPIATGDYTTLLDDLTEEIQVRIAWKLEQQLKNSMEQLIHDAVERSAGEIRQAIRAQLEESLPSVIEQLKGK